MISNTEPLDRMNYFNGQRLEARDFRLDQDYHMRVRRLLNSSLYTYGIASGLEVTVKAGDAHRVVVSPGLALDPEGREIVVLEDTELLVTGLPSPVEGVAVGNYLTIRYTEAPVDRFQDGCQVAGPAGGGQRLAWGGPTRLRAGALLEWTNTWPAADSGQIVLVQAELDETCAVRALHTGVRKYVGTSQNARTLTYALEGEKDIDSSNPKQLYFHIRGGQPEAVTLYLRGAKFSSLYYTELGKHTHDLDISLPAHAGVAGHTHTILDELETSPEPGHSHVIRANTSDEPNREGLELSESPVRMNLNEQVDLVVELDGDHFHTINPGGATGPAVNMPALDHSFTATEAGETGVGPSARTSPETSYRFPDNLEVFVDGISYTAEILNRLGWTSLGDGGPNHDFVTAGTGAIQIDLLGVDLSEGEHLIELRLATGGGRVLYNLYVE
jgi:hypothetical protein